MRNATASAKLERDLRQAQRKQFWPPSPAALLVFAAIGAVFAAIISYNRILTTATVEYFNARSRTTAARLVHLRYARGGGRNHSRPLFSVRVQLPDGKEFDAQTEFFAPKGPIRLQYRVGESGRFYIERMKPLPKSPNEP